MPSRGNAASSKFMARKATFSQFTPGVSSVSSVVPISVPVGTGCQVLGEADMSDQQELGMLLSSPS